MIVHLKDVKTGRVYDMDLGMGHVLNSTPVSILSVSKLIPTGMRFHFEKNNNYCIPPSGDKEGAAHPQRWTLLLAAPQQVQARIGNNRGAGRG